MLANRVSYCLGLCGPSFLIDTACSSSMYALDAAFTAIRNGECDAALVGGSNLLLFPYTTLQFARFVKSRFRACEIACIHSVIVTFLRFDAGWA